MNTLFINSCIRENSRTRVLAEHLLNKLDSSVTEICLTREKDLFPLDADSLALRDELIRRGETDHPMLHRAKQFAEADCIVVAAPFWDLGFPALLKTYLEQVTVCGLTFRYTPEGIPEGLCKAKQLFYITTAGGPIAADYGFRYLRDLSEIYYGIRKTVCFQAENLDIIGADIPAILSAAKEQIDAYFV